MTRAEKVSLLLLRVSLGWMMLYAGITKLMNPDWSAAGFLKDAKTFTGFYQWLALPANISWVNFLNEWGLTLLGVSLILGIGVRFSSVLGSAMMFLYYLVNLNFPNVGTNAFLVDQHIIYILLLLFFAVNRAGRVYGLEAWCANLPICRKFPGWHAWWG